MVVRIARLRPIIPQQVIWIGWRPRAPHRCILATLAHLNLLYVAAVVGGQGRAAGATVRLEAASVLHYSFTPICTKSLQFSAVDRILPNSCWPVSKASNCQWFLLHQMLKSLPGVYSEYPPIACEYSKCLQSQHNFITHSIPKISSGICGQLRATRSARRCS